MKYAPPAWMTRLFQWFCSEDLREAVEGDLLALYNERRERMSRSRANLLYFINVISFMQLFAIRKERINPFSNSSIMFFNHLKVGFRLMRRHFTYSTINILGLAFGLSAVILITLFIQHELSFDRFHGNGKDIVRLTYRLETPSATRLGAKLPFPVKKVLEEEYPEVMKTARFYNWDGDTPLLEYGDHKFTEDGIYFAESDVFQVFDFEFISGDPSTALSDPRSIILTEKVVAKYFGNNNPMGEIMRYKNEDDLIVTGVIKDIPDNSHIAFDVLLPIELQRQRWMGWGKYTYDLEKDWNWAAAWTYAQLSPGTDINLFQEKVQAIASDYFNVDGQEGFSIEVQPLFDIHLKSNKSAEARPNGNMVQLYGFGLVAMLILLIACINFVNLTSAQANERLKEVGLRKVMGARKINLVTQFIVESFALVTISCIVSLMIGYMSLPYFNEFMSTSLTIGWQEIPIISATLVFAMFLALVSGLRPSMAVIRINAIHRFGIIKSKQRFGKVMIVGQFIVCNLLFIGILVVNQQLDYLRGKELGFDKEQMLIIRHARNLSKDQYEVFENEMKGIPSVINMHRGYVAGTSSYSNTFKRVGSEDESTYSLGIKWIGEGFTEMFDLEVIAGRNFNPTIEADVQSGILINESAAKALGWTLEESLGKRISFLPGGASEPEEIMVLGVLADANFESLYDPVQPSVFRMPRSNVGSEVCLKLAGTENLLTTLDRIETAWDQVIPEWPFEFTFLNEKIQKQYVKEERLASATRYFTILAILIACSGLFGLASFAVQKRSKEIGVRKVLGASVNSVFLLISKGFLILIGISFILSIPLGYYLTERWLEDFAYRIEVGLQVFLLAGTFSMLMVMIAVGFQSLKAAKSNPVKTLRYE